MKVKEVSIEHFAKERVLYYKGGILLLFSITIVLILFLQMKKLTIEKQYQGVVLEDGLIHLIVSKKEMKKWEERKKVKIEGTWRNYRVKEVLYHREEPTMRELLLEVDQTKRDFQSSSMLLIILEQEKCSVQDAIIDMLGGTYA